jgi:regulator of nucleoside diphosphate kinase
MENRVIYITQFDLERLEDLLAVAEEFSYRDRVDLEELEAELDNCKIVDSREIPPNIVTMNSKVQLKNMDNGEEKTFTLVFPRDANLAAEKLSVVSPIGTAILGYAEGDIINWRVPAGIRSIKIEKILYQPEAAGDYHL